jgi:ankyrin repeat protein
MAVLAQHPPRAELNAGLQWALRQDVSDYKGRNNISRIEMLISAGADVNQPDRYGVTPLTYTVKGGDSRSPLVKLLIDSGANVNARDDNGKTALDAAKQNNSSPKCQQILTDAGAVTTNDAKQPR